MNETDFDTELRAELREVRRTAPVPADLTQRLLLGLNPATSRQAPAGRRRAARVGRSPFLRALALGAAAAIVLVAAAVIADRRPDRPASPVTGVPDHTTPASVPTRPTTTPPTAAVALLDRWGGTRLSTVVASGIAVSDDSIYVVAAVPSRPELLRLSAGGAVMARASINVPTRRNDHTEIVSAGGRIWTVVKSGRSVGVRSFDPQSLQPEQFVALPDLTTGDSEHAQPSLAADPRGDLLYAAFGHNLVRIDVASARVTGTLLTSPDLIGAISLSPDGRRLYVATDPVRAYSAAGGAAASVLAIDPAAGTVFARLNGEFAFHAGVILSLAATNNGVWESDQGGPHVQGTQFVPHDLDADRRGSIPPGGYGGGGVYAWTVVSGGIAWSIGGVNAVSCQSTEDARVLDHVSPSDVIITDLAVLGGTAYALYHADGSSGVVRFPIPQTCRR